ncbi:MAG: GntP family permease [Firmicutes bacterium]|nr:GntP family permease [Bacillota bacterium]
MLLGVDVSEIMPVTLLGVLVALVISIFLIIRKLNPALAMFLGVFVGALVGGVNLTQILDIFVVGGRQVVGINIRIIAGGVLAGALIETGAAESIARGIVKGLGEKRAVLAIALSAMVVTGVGVFIPVAMLVVSPVALAVAYKANVSKFSAILAISGGAKAGNIMSPNPNALAAAESFNLSLSEVMLNGFIPGVAALAMTIILGNIFKKKHYMVKDTDLENANNGENPPFSKAIVAPVVTIGLLMLNPIGDIAGIYAISTANLPMDPLYVLPLGATVGVLAMGKSKNLLDIATKGALRMAPVVLMLFGAGTIGGLIMLSVFPEIIQNTMSTLGLPYFLIAPISSTIFSSATGSHAAGVIIASEAFAVPIMQAGIASIAAAVMLHAGGGFLDVVPHGNIFLATQQGMKCTIQERLKVMPFEALVGATTVSTAILLHLLGFWA